MNSASSRAIAAIQAILEKFVPGTEVHAFGSRVLGTSRRHSDLDLVILGKRRIGLRPRREPEE